MTIQQIEEYLDVYDYSLTEEEKEKFIQVLYDMEKLSNDNNAENH